MKNDNFSSAVIRTPRYPLNGIRQIPSDLKECIAFFQSWLVQKEVRNALSIASPDLLERADVCLAGKDPREQQKMINTLLKYFIRMHARATPFGMFSGITAGSIAKSTNLIPEHNKSDLIKARINFNLLWQVSDIVQTSLNSYSSVRFKKNPTLFRYNNSIHCVVHYKSNGQRMFRLNVVEYEKYLQFLFNHEEIIEYKQITDVVREFIEDANATDVNEFIQTLLNEQLIYFDLDVPIVSDNCTADYVNKIKSLSPTLAESLNRVNELLEALENPENDIQLTLGQVMDVLQKQQIPISKKNILRLDTYRNFESSTVSIQVKEQLLLTLAVLNQWHTRNASEIYRLFNTKFEGKCVPLLHLLDEELGIQFSADGGYNSDLLSGLKFNSSHKIEKDFSSVLAERVQNVSERLKQHIELSSKELLQGPLHDLITKLPSSFAVSATLYTNDDGKEIIHLHSSHSCSAANLLTRFSHLNEDLYNIIKEVIDTEEEQFPDIIFAEVVHIPSPAHGNVASRGALRDYEIVFFSESTSNANRITLDDLWVYCEDNFVKLWSKKLNKQVIPRLTSAHNFGYQSLGIYEFLCSLQLQYNSAPSISTSFSSNLQRYSPRISIDNVIVSPACWRIKREDLAKIFDGNRFMQDHWDYLVINFSLEPWVQYSVADNSLQICLTNFVFWQLLMAETEGKSEISLYESLCMKYISRVYNSEGQFAHEIIIPYLNKSSKDMIRTGATPVIENKKDKFLPGDQWLSLKLYAAPSTCESILLEIIHPYVKNLSKSNKLDNFFYIRYIDNDFHLRLRFSADSDLLLDIFQNLREILEPELQCGRLHRVEYFTYDRETERYGGHHCIDICESIFSIESKTIIELLANNQDKIDNLRWRAALKLFDAMLCAFDYSIEQKLTFASKGRAIFGREFGDDLYMRNQLGSKYRNHKNYIETDFFDGSIDEIANVIQLVHFNYKNSIHFLASKIRSRLVDEDKIYKVLSSLIHMLINRIFVSSPRQHELVVYDYMRRIYLRQNNSLKA